MKTLKRYREEVFALIFGLAATLLASVIVVAILALTSSPARAAEPLPLSSADLGREAAFFYLMSVDYHQTTAAFSYTGSGYYTERNPFIKHGYEGVYFIGMSAGHMYVASRLDPGWRQAWQYGWIALELATVVHNKHAGLNYAF